MGKNTQPYLQGFFDKMRAEQEVSKGYSEYTLEDALERIQMLSYQNQVTRDRLVIMEHKVYQLENQLRELHTTNCGK